MSKWPMWGFSVVPTADSARELALEVRNTCGRTEADCLSDEDLRRICQLGDFEVRMRKLKQSGRPFDAILIPKQNGGFEIIVDPDGAEKEDTDAVDWGHMAAVRKQRFLIAHEIAHGFFYDRRRRPATRLSAGGWAEELFCDQFANALLVPPGAVRNLRPSPDKVLELEAKFCVPAELAGRALGMFHPDIAIGRVRLHQTKLSAMEGNAGVEWWQPEYPGIRDDMVVRCRAVIDADAHGRGESFERWFAHDPRCLHRVAVTRSEGNSWGIILVWIDKSNECGKLSQTEHVISV